MPGSHIERQTPAPGQSGQSALPDGRRLRAARNRAAVVDALLALYDEGHLKPGAALLADRAGVSQSTVFRLFDDLETLVEVAIQHQWERLKGSFRPPATDGSSTDRVRAIADQRLALHAAAGPALRGARLLAVDSPALVTTFAARRDLLRRQVEHHFAGELDLLGDRRDRQRLTDALDATLSLEHIEYLRHERGLGVERTAAALQLAVTSLLSHSIDQSHSTDQLPEEP